MLVYEHHSWLYINITTFNTPNKTEVILEDDYVTQISKFQADSQEL